jgi:hypothetical protein
MEVHQVLHIVYRTCTVVAQVIFTDGAPLFGGDYVITKSLATAKQGEVIYCLSYCLLPENEKNYMNNNQHEVQLTVNGPGWPADSQLYHLPHIYILPPYDVLLIHPKHVQV